jgi:hypothetical protein
MIGAAVHKLNSIIFALETETLAGAEKRFRVAIDGWRLECEESAETA